MRELESLRNISKAQHIFYVCDAMMGQDAVTTAQGFAARLQISGVVMTKMDGDARGGAALSVKSVLGKPLRFVGTGEGLDQFEIFRPEGMASRILGLGDIVGLVQDFEKVAKGDEEEKARKMLEGQFNLNDFYEQIQMIQKMGSLKDLVAKIPGAGGMLGQMGAQVDEKELGKIRYMIDSMTQDERLRPSVFNPSRVARVAKGSGRSPREVQGLIEKFSKMRKMMAMVGKNLGTFKQNPWRGWTPANGPDEEHGGKYDRWWSCRSYGMGSRPSMRPKFDRDKAKKMKKQAVPPKRRIEKNDRSWVKSI